jgi:hypothetical protein
MRQLPQIWGRGNSQVPRLPHRDLWAPDLEARIARDLRNEGGIEPGMRTLPLRAQWKRLPASQVRPQEF